MNLIGSLFIDHKLPPFDPLARLCHISSLLLLHEVQVAPIPIGTTFAFFCPFLCSTVN